MHLLPEPLFTLPTDSTYMQCVAGSANTGRVFLGGRDGCLYEFAYRADNGWFGKKATKVNKFFCFKTPNSKLAIVLNVEL